MNKKLMVNTLLVMFLCGCQSLGSSKKLNEWDFDHNVQYKQNQIATNAYSVEIVSSQKTRFDQMATFLLRHAYRVCESYGFKLEVITGVEGVDERRVSPSYIQPNLKAMIECPIQ